MLRMTCLYKFLKIFKNLKCGRILCKLYKSLHFAPYTLYNYNLIFRRPEHHYSGANPLNEIFILNIFDIFSYTFQHFFLILPFNYI